MNLALNIAQRGMAVSQAALTTVANNIANINTEGYSRQTVLQKASITTRYNGQNIFIGTGVDIQSISRIRSSFYDMQYRDSVQSSSYNKLKYDALSQIESTFKEPTDNGIETCFMKLHNALQDLSTNPSDEALKKIVQEAGIALTTTFRDIAAELKDVKTQYVSLASSTTFSVNSLLSDIQTVNDQIGRLDNDSNIPNDLLDKRDLLLDNLSKLIPIQVVGGQGLQINVISSGRMIVYDGGHSTLSSSMIAGNVALNWEDGSAYNPTAGEMGAMLDVCNKFIPSYQSQLDTLAVDFMTAFNAQHRLGFTKSGATGIDFFQGTSASDFDVSAAIRASASNIAPSLDGTVGDNGNLIALAALNDASIVSGATISPMQFYNNLATGLAIEAKQAKGAMDNADYVTDEIDVRRKNVSGVSSDEEMTNMVNYQHAYQAAAKLVSSVNDMYDTLINMVR